MDTSNLTNDELIFLVDIIFYYYLVLLQGKNVKKCLKIRKNLVSYPFAITYLSP